MTEIPSDASASMAEPPPLPSHTRRRWIGVIFAAVGLLATYAVIFNDFSGFDSQDKLAWRQDPVALAMRFADREMAFQELARTIPQPLRFLLKWEWDSDDDDDLNAIRALEECEAFLRARGNSHEHPELALALAILAGERGDQDAMENWLTVLQESPGGEEVATRLRNAYANPSRQVFGDTSLEARHLDGTQWFFMVLAARFLESHHETEEAEVLRAQATMDLEGRTHVFKTLAISDFIVLLVGLVGVWVWRKRDPPPACAAACWSPVTAFNIYAWAGLLGVACLLTVWFASYHMPQAQVLGMMTMPWYFGPTLVVFYLAVCLPNRMTLRQIFGLRPTLPMVAAGFALLLIDRLVQMGWFKLVETLDVVASPIEGLSEELIWGNITWRVFDTLDASLGAGILEEVVYRGIIFLGLRHRFGFTTSALASTVIFTLPHVQYGWVGLVSVAIFGFLAAWSVERTRSLLPAIIAHTYLNLSISLWQWSVFA